jgi:hypothetical protein
MALSKTIQITGTSVIQTSFGNFENGSQSLLLPFYIKVMTIGGDKEKMFATVNFKSSDRQFNKQYSFVPNMESNFIAQAYAYLRTLPEFAGASDC